MGTLDIDGLTKTYGEEDEEIVAVDDLTLHIRDGEFVVLVGPSGCGKSTSLRCIAGLERDPDGDVSINGESIMGKKPKNRNIAMVFQNYALYPHMTARENMSFGLKMTTDLPKAEIESKVDETAEMMGINDLLNHRPSELSGGQQQRVALGRAIVRNPEVFLMDEPLSNLDAKLRNVMRTELKALQAELGTTTIYVTHDQTEAMTMGDRIAILHDGKLQQFDTPLECYYRPANRFVAGFIGSPSMNFFDGRFDADRQAFVHEDLEYRFTDRIDTAGLEDGDAVTLGVRPEDIELATDSDTNQLSATVEVVEPLGDEIHATLRAADQLTAQFPPNVQLQRGDNLDISFLESAIHLFDASSGQALVNSSLPTDRPASKGVA